MKKYDELQNQKDMNRITLLLHEYAQRVGLSNDNVDGEVTNESYCRLLFSAILNDYQNWKLSVHDLSSICERMWQKCEKFSDVLLEGAEINWYLRKRPQHAADALNGLINEFGTESVDQKTE